MPIPRVRGYDVVVIGSGPNGLAAAIVAAQRGLATLVLEARDTPGGALRSAELTQPGFVHDSCSSVHPMGIASPFLRSLPIAQNGLEWVTPPAAAAHPLDGGDAVMLYNDLARTADSLGTDGSRYRRIIGSIVRDWPLLEDDLFGPIGLPRHPFAFAPFGIRALQPACSLATRAFSTARARALFAGAAGHSLLPLSRTGSSAIALVLLAAAHVHAWPVARGGSGAIASALIAHFRSLGGEIRVDMAVTAFDQIPEAKYILFDTSPRAMAQIMGHRFSRGFADALRRYRYGPGVFKVDWALREPIPWKARECRLAATVHVGGALDEIAAAEAAPWRGEHADRPFLILTQPSLFDATRAPAGQHTGWAYCHVPNGSAVDMTERIERQVERFAPGFGDVILARAARSPAVLEQENANLLGGDVGAGSNDLLNLIFRPTWRRYATPAPNVWLCSASTPPGGGVHGMCGYHAAIRALRKVGRP